MEEVWHIIWRSTLAFCVIMIAARQLSKATVAQMTYHDFVAAITLGALTANLAYNIKMSFWQPLVSLLMFAGIAYVLMFIALKSRKLRTVISGRPTVLMQDGVILEGNLRKQKITLDTLNQELREKGVFNIDEVDYAVLELNGKISVLKKPEFLPVTRKDMKMQVGKQQFPVELIMDGKVLDKNLRQNALTEEWLLAELRSQGKQLDQVNYAVRSTSGDVFTDAYKDRIKRPLDKE